MRHRSFLILLTLFAVAVAVDGATPAQRPVRELRIVASECRFVPDVIDATEGDRVRILIKALDAPHTFVVKEYRIARLVVPGRELAIDLRVDKPGIFDFYSDLASDARCTAMRGQFIVYAAR